MAAKTPSVALEPGWRSTRPDWRWMFASGVLAIALGLLGLGLTPVLTIAAVLALGLVLAGAAVYQLIQGVRTTEWRRRMTRFGYAGAYAFGGAAMVLSPGAAAAGLTVLLAVLFGMAGFRALFANLNQRDHRDWGARALLGGAFILTGTLLLLTWPVSSIWAIGTGVSVVLLTKGWRNVVGALTERGHERNHPPGTDEDSAALVA